MKNDKRLDTSYKQINTKKSFKNMIFLIFWCSWFISFGNFGFRFPKRLHFNQSVATIFFSHLEALSIFRHYIHT